MKSGIISLGGICGVVFPIILFGTVFLSVSYAPNFDWNSNWLSDMGGQIPNAPDPLMFTVPGIIDMPLFDRPYVSNEATVSIFNTGLALSGIILLIFAIGLRKSLMTPAGRLSALVLILGAIAYIITGIFPENLGIFHSAPAMLLFLFPPTAMCCIGVSMLETDKGLAYLTFILGIIGYVGITVLSTGLEIQISMLLGSPTYLRATPEMINMLAVSIFTIIYGVKLFKGQNPILSK
jgi:hypothetical membrane protein